MTSTPAKFVLHIKASTPGSSGRRLSNPNNSTEAKVVRKKIVSKEEQLNQAVLWCRENKCCGYSAMKSGLCPSVKNRRTIDKRGAT